MVLNTPVNFMLVFKCAAFFDQIFPWTFWSIDQLDRVLHICLEFCHVVLRCVVLRLAVRVALCCD